VARPARYVVDVALSHIMWLHGGSTSTKRRHTHTYISLEWRPLGSWHAPCACPCTGLLALHVCACVLAQALPRPDARAPLRARHEALGQCLPGISAPRGAMWRAIQLGALLRACAHTNQNGRMCAGALRGRQHSRVSARAGAGRGRALGRPARPRAAAGQHKCAAAAPTAPAAATAALREPPAAAAQPGQRGGRDGVREGARGGDQLCRHGAGHRGLPGAAGGSHAGAGAAVRGTRRLQQAPGTSRSSSRPLGKRGTAPVAAAVGPGWMSLSGRGQCAPNHRIAALQGRQRTQFRCYWAAAAAAAAAAAGLLTLQGTLDSGHTHTRTCTGTHVRNCTLLHKHTQSTHKCAQAHTPFTSHTH